MEDNKIFTYIISILFFITLFLLHYILHYFHILFKRKMYHEFYIKISDFDVRYNLILIFYFNNIMHMIKLECFYISDFK
jgi:hypothetical protein